jgi:predicted DCC family thiol-disulfide oxidoreductase YuxK
MMRRSRALPTLLYDGECPTCAGLADELAVGARGGLLTASLRDPDVQRLLDQLQPGWRWEPMLIIGRSGRQRVRQGAMMGLRLIPIIGVRAAIAAARRARQIRGIGDEPAVRSQGCSDCGSDDWRTDPILSAAVSRTRQCAEVVKLGLPAPEDVWRQDDSEDVIVLYLAEPQSATRESYLACHVGRSGEIRVRPVTIETQPEGWNLTNGPVMEVPA